MHTFGTMAKALNRSKVYLQSLQKRFDLPVVKGTAYSNSYPKEEGGLPEYTRIRKVIL